MSTQSIATPVHTDPNASVFIDRRNSDSTGSPSRERRQFANSHSDLSPQAAELARAIDSYKLQHRRRFIDADELLKVITSLGYSK